MKTRLRIRKAGASLVDAVYDINDAESFGRACADAWMKLRERRLGRATSIGELMERLDQNILDDLRGAELSLGAE
jgi:hypothetical protein